MTVRLHDHQNDSGRRRTARHQGTGEAGALLAGAPLLFLALYALLSLFMLVGQVVLP